MTFDPIDVVESYMVSVTADPAIRQACFTFRTPDGQRKFSLRVEGVTRLLMNEFLHQNIVHDVYRFGADSDPVQVRDLLAALMFDQERAADIVEPTFQAILDDSAAAVLAGRMVLFKIEPVFGASALIAGASFEWASD